jgi:hypothetical protein
MQCDLTKYYPMGKRGGLFPPEPKAADDMAKHYIEYYVRMGQPVPADAVHDPAAAGKKVATKGGNVVIKKTPVVKTTIPKKSAGKKIVNVSTPPATTKKIVKTAIPVAKQTVVTPVAGVSHPTAAELAAVNVKVHHSATYLKNHGRENEVTASTPLVTTYGPKNAATREQGAIDTWNEINNPTGAGQTSAGSILSKRNAALVSSIGKYLLIGGAIIGTIYVVRRYKLLSGGKAA